MSQITVDQIRSRINHPIIDADGHMIEFMPAVRDYVVELGGEGCAEIFDMIFMADPHAPKPDADTRRVNGMYQLSWWAYPARNTLDRATGMMPRLLYQRLDEFGIDYAIIYPTSGLGGPVMPDAEVRQVFCRAFNTYLAEEYAEYSDRMTPAAVIPMHTPEEAIAELEYAVNTLKLKTAVLAGAVQRPLPGDNLPRTATWLDTLGHNSAYDYDPVWAKCIELGIAPTFHTSAMGWPGRTSLDNYVYNHIGNFAVGGEVTCRSLIMGGVYQRFPELRTAYLEGGVGWATNLYSDLVGHWEKRCKDLDNYDPRNIDREQLRKLFDEYASEKARARAEQFEAGINVLSYPGRPAEIQNEFAATGFTAAEDIKALFNTNLYFGCEADDPMNALAFNKDINPLGATLNPIFSSDISHWDVPEMNGVLPEAYELVEDGLLNEEEFRAFTFANDAKMLLEAKPDFFADTVLANKVGDIA